VFDGLERTDSGSTKVSQAIWVILNVVPLDRVFRVVILRWRCEKSSVGPKVTPDGGIPPFVRASPPPWFGSGMGMIHRIHSNTPLVGVCRDWDSFHSSVQSQKNPLYYIIGDFFLYSSSRHASSNSIFSTQSTLIPFYLFKNRRSVLQYKASSASAKRFALCTLNALNDWAGDGGHPFANRKDRCIRSIQNPSRQTRERKNHTPGRECFEPCMVAMRMQFMDGFTQSAVNAFSEWRRTASCRQLLNSGFSEWFLWTASVNGFYVQRVNGFVQWVALRELPCEHQKGLRQVVHIRDIDLAKCPIICKRDPMQHKAEDNKARITAGREEKEVHHYTILRATSQSFVDPPNDRVELSPYGAHPPNTGTVQYGAGQGERNSLFIDSGSAPLSLLGEE